MRFFAFFLLLFWSVTAFTADRVPAPRSPSKPNRLICKTGPESRPAAQALKLYFQYHLPILFEPEDPTVGYGRQTVVLSGRPVVQLHFERAGEPAGDNGEKLDPMTCAFAKRVVAANEPALVQIFLPSAQVHWLTQAIGQRPGPKQLSFERAVITPAGDWAFASQFEKVFAIELDDTKNFVTAQQPKPL